MKKILITRRLLRENEDRASKMFKVELNLNDELYSQSKLLELSKDCDGILVPGGFGERGTEGKIRSIRYAREMNVPFFGICLGMQMMMSKSFEFGEIEGLGIINGDVIKIPASNSENIKHKIPHIGWNRIFYKEDKLLTRQNSKSSMYFVHSYHLLPENSGDVLGLSNYGYDFAAVIRKDNFWGVQFHPEFKSRPFTPHPLFSSFIKAAETNRRDN